MFLKKSNSQSRNAMEEQGAPNAPLNNFNPNLVKRVADVNTFNKKYGYNKREIVK